MRELLIVYILGLSLGTFIPERVASFSFVNISKSLNFQIDPESPVLAAEKDLMTYQQSLPSKSIANYKNLNQQAPRRQTQQFRLVDYSRELKDIHDAIGVTLVGPIELRQGLALTDEYRIEIFREHKGEIFEFGDIDIENGNYVIKPQQLSGQICARLRGRSFEILGQGCYALSMVKNIKASSHQGPALSLSKYQDLLALREPISLPKTIETVEVKPKLAPPSPTGKIIDYYDLSHPDPQPLPNVSVDNSMGGSEDEFSYLVSRIQAPGYVPVRIVGNQYTPSKKVPMPRNKTAQAAAEIAKREGVSPGNDSDLGAIWGGTNRDGKSIAGATVFAEGHPDLKPIYLNEFYIPDIHQKVTASHGLFILSGVPDGEYALRAEIGDQFLGFQNASVRSGHISLANIESSLKTKSLGLFLYDLISKTPQPGVVTLQNYPEEIVVEEGQSEVQIQETLETGFAYVNPLTKGYLAAQYLVSPDESELQIPLIKANFMDSLLSQVKLEKNLRGKIVMGIGSKAAFRVQAVGSKAQIVYFDSNGVVTEGAFGPAGGGFLILDPEDHVVEYGIQEAGKKEVRGVYFPSQIGVLSVIPLY